MVAVEPLEPYHIVVVAQKSREGVAARRFDEDAFREALRKSPFESDRQSALSATLGMPPQRVRANFALESST